MKKLTISLVIALACAAILAGSAMATGARKDSLTAGQSSDEDENTSNREPSMQPSQMPQEQSAQTPNDSLSSAQESEASEGPSTVPKELSPTSPLSDIKGTLQSDDDGSLSQSTSNHQSPIMRKKKQTIDIGFERLIHNSNLDEGSDNEAERASEKRHSTGSLEHVIGRLQAVSLESSSRRSSVESSSGSRRRLNASSHNEESTESSRPEYSVLADDDEDPFLQLKPSAIQSEMQGRDSKTNSPLKGTAPASESESKLQLMREIAALRPSKFTAMATKPSQSTATAEHQLSKQTPKQTPNESPSEIPPASSIIASSRNPNASSTSPMGSPKSLESSFSVKMKSSHWEQMAKKAHEQPTIILMNTPKKKQPGASISSVIGQFESLSSSEPGSPSLSRSNSGARKVRPEGGEVLKNCSQRVEHLDEAMEKDEILQTKALSSVSNSPFKQSEIIIQPMPPEMVRKGSWGVAKKESHFYDDFADFTDEE